MKILICLLDANIAIIINLKDLKKLEKIEREKIIDLSYRNPSIAVSWLNRYFDPLIR